MCRLIFQPTGIGLAATVLADVTTKYLGKASGLLKKELRAAITIYPAWSHTCTTVVYPRIS